LTGKRSEGRIVLSELLWFFGLIRSEIATALVVSIAVTLVFILARCRFSDSFITNLITVNSILIAATGLLAPFVAQGSRFIGFVEKVEADYWGAKNAAEKGFKAQLLSRSVGYLTLLPLLAIFPFFASVILALGALIARGNIRLTLTASAFWLMLWCFLSIVSAIWKLTLKQRRTIKSF